MDWALDLSLPWLSSPLTLETSKLVLCSQAATVLAPTVQTLTCTQVLTKARRGNLLAMWLGEVLPVLKMETLAFGSRLFCESSNP